MERLRSVFSVQGLVDCTEEIEFARDVVQTETVV